MFLAFRSRHAIAQWSHRARAVLAAVFVSAAFCAPAQAENALDSLTLLVPDGTAVTGWPVRVWTDSAAEEGLQIKTMTDSAFLALGTRAVAEISGLILPDSAHIQASDALVAAVKQYVNQGGKLMLTYDAASLTDAGFYAAAGRSRFSDMVGVDYVLDQSLRDRVVGFGPIVGTRGRLDNLALPPGKYLPYTEVDAAGRPAAALAAGARAVNTASVPYVPTNRFDPGGSAFMRSYLKDQTGGPSALARGASRPGLRYDRLVTEASPALAQSRTPSQPVDSLRGSHDWSAVATQGGSSWYENRISDTRRKLAEGDKALQVVSGYGFGALSYYHFVTTGSFPGQVFLSSPDYGLVAGERTYGAGKVLFVNIPLGFFKAIGTDGVLLHGFLNHFARDQVAMPRLSVQPKGIGGLVYNWHVDDGDDIVPEFRQIMAMDFMQKRGPFSVHFTAGPDVNTIGDGLGMNLPQNPAAQDVVLKTGKFGRYAWAHGMQHELGSHGGWNHNIYGINANETNAATYLPWLTQNVAAIEDVTGRRLREYSAPQGNNPNWSTRWLESHGVVGMYTVSNTGSAATREWRDGTRLTDRLWAMPIAPLGKAATFEEFEENGVTDLAGAQWLIDLQSFVVNHRTNRLFYNHPPGALAHLGVVKTFVNRAQCIEREGRFNWYTMAEIADFAQRRVQTTWRSTSQNGRTTFVASNPESLTDMTWLLPRSRYRRPDITSGAGVVHDDDPAYFLVTARRGNSISFAARER